jgi:hypothetical protein
MCVFRQPTMPAPDPSIEQDRQDRLAKEMATAKQNKEDALEQTLQKKKKGIGVRSLLTSSSGGIGFYNQYD